jgi:hypothetical protein
VVDRWLDMVAHNTSPADLEPFVHPDIVVVLHGVGAQEDGTPRRVEGLPAVRGWLEQLRARQPEPPEVRVDDRLTEGSKVALRGRNVWTIRTDSGTSKLAQSIAAFYYVEDEKIVLIERYVGGVRPKVS